MPCEPPEGLIVDKGEVMNVVIAIIGRITGRETEKIQPMTSLDELGMSPYMLMVVLRELERQGRTPVIPDNELPILVATARSWATVQQMANAALDRTTLPTVEDLAKSPASPVAEPRPKKRQH